MDFDLALHNQLSERQRKKSGNVERIYSRRQIEQAFLESFEMIGGIPRLALWANDPDNYGTFLQLLMKLSPKEATGQMLGQVIEYRTNVPTSPLNRPAPAPQQEAEEGVLIDADD